MPVNEDIDRLASLAVTIADRPDWQSFADYLGLRTQGRRREALASLGKFIDATRSWSFDQRLSFVLWLTEQEASMRSVSPLIPAPLWQAVAGPTASEWLARAPDDAGANYVYAIYVVPACDAMSPLDHLRRAVLLDPSLHRARTRFVHRVVAAAQYAQHELPWYGYLGSAIDDIRDLRDALVMADGLEETVMQPALMIELSMRLETAEAWEKFERSGAGGTFADWCATYGAPAGMAARLLPPEA